MPGPTWNTDDPQDAARRVGNAAALARALSADANLREQPTVALACSWHVRLYAGCVVPSQQYLGAFRGDADRPDLVDYELGVGPLQPDGYPENVGVWSRDVSAAVGVLVADVASAVTVLDARFPVGTRPQTVEHLHGLVQVLAAVHGEWVRIHPFANGNGRTARVWAAWLAVRYGLPVFVSLQPRPADTAYARAGRASMGRPPDFLGDHSEATNVFLHLLTLALLP